MTTFLRHRFVFEDADTTAWSRPRAVVGREDTAAYLLDALEHIGDCGDEHIIVGVDIRVTK